MLLNKQVSVNLEFLFLFEIWDNLRLFGVRKIDSIDTKNDTIKKNYPIKTSTLCIKYPFG